METTTDKYLIALSGCRIVCNHRKEPQVRITTMDRQGVTVEERPFREVFRGASIMPFFTATYSRKGREFNVDLDCGAQRWAGPQTAAAVRKALAKCGVARDLSRRIVAEAVRAGADNVEWREEQVPVRIW
jgi:hypothetical protein